MANELLYRNPTSVGNRRVWTWSAWIKHNLISETGLPGIFSVDNSTAGQVNIGIGTTNGGYYSLNSTNASESSSIFMAEEKQHKDYASWINLVISVDTTKDDDQNAVGIYVNGVKDNIKLDTYPGNSQNVTKDHQSMMNFVVPHIIGAGRYFPNYMQMQMFDLFIVDGQALTPDVFGFYKSGKGYISSGSSVATDFRPGQWVPKTPRIIKAEINRRGGFGVNGVYLPMNDGNNFGADFHGTSNSIIKLQENLPQPKCRIDGVGDYTGALREDPFKQYLIYAQPNVSGGLQNGYGDYSHIIRGSGTPKVITGGASGTPTISTTQSLYYGSSLYFDGNDTINVETNDSNYLGRDFTIEFWVWHDGAYPINQMAFNTTPHTSFGISLNRGGSGQTALFIGNGGNWQLTDFRSGGRLYSQQWNHVVVERHNNAITIYHNGVAQGSYKQGDQVVTNSGTFTGVMPTGFSSLFRYGTYENTSGEPVLGYIQDYRIYSGVAKYKGGFDVPRPYTPAGIATWRAVPDTTANNFCTWNPLSAFDGTQTNGNLTTTTNDIMGTIGVNSGKWYWEIYDTTAVGGGGNIMHHGVSFGNYNRAIGGGFSNAPEGLLNIRMDGVNQSTSGTTITITSQTGTVPTYSNGDIYAISLDLDLGQVRHYRNGLVILTTNFTYNKNTYAIPYTRNNGLSCSANFGQNPTFSGNTTAGTFPDSNGKGLFKYQPPAGFLALCEDNLPKPAIEDPGKHFKTILYTGDGSSGRSITGLGFKPDLVWIKNRDVGGWHIIGDSVRGANKALFTNNANQENTSSTTLTGTILSYDNDGFSLAVDPDSTGNSGWNTTGNKHVAWCWKAGNTTQTNTDGTITSTVSVNQTAGFSIVSYTGNGTGLATVGHGLNKNVAIYFVKNRSTSANWAVLGHALNRANGGSNSYLLLNSSNAIGVASQGPGNSKTIELWNDSTNNTSGNNYIAYCWAEIEGYSKMGSYVGNGSTNGPFVYCGFKPAFVMRKIISGTGSWEIIDNSRSSTNPASRYLYADLALVETDYPNIDFLSNGFKCRTADTGLNSSGSTYIFVAFAESPFQTANAK